MSDDPVSNTPDSASATNVTREASTKRQFVRVQMPVTVVIDGQKYNVADWSLGGFGVDGVTRTYEKGQRVKALLSFMFHGYAFTMMLGCEIVFVSRDGSEIGCRFENITPDQHELIRYLINAHLSGRIANVDGILSAAAHRNLPVASEKDAPAPLTPAEKAVVVLRKAVRYGVYGGLGFGVLLLIYLSVYSRFFTVRSEFAAVTAPVVRMRAAEDGWLDFADYKLGDRVRKGDLIFRVSQPDLETEIANVRSLLEREQAQLAAYRAQAGNLEKFFEDYKALSSSELEQAQEQFDITRKHLDRIAKLNADGFASARALDEARAAYAEAKTALDTARINTNMVDQGFYYSGSRVEGEAPEQIQSLIAVAGKNVQLYENSLEALLQKRDKLAQTSPCDCVVQDIRSSDGEFVQKGEMVYVLQEPAGEDIIVEAKVPHTELPAVEVGAKAEVLFADDDTVIEGRVVDVSHFRQSSVFSGLPDFVSSDPNLGTVLVAVHRTGGAKTLGLPSQVRFPISFKKKIFSVFGVETPT